MPITDNRTAGRDYLLPHPENSLKDDVLRDILAKQAIDADITAILLALGGKSSAGHGHFISDIGGLEAALEGKLAVGHHDALDDLSDVNVTGAANGQVLIRQGGQWIPLSLQIGNTSDLEAALDARVSYGAAQGRNAAQQGIARANMGLGAILGTRKIINGRFDIWQRGTTVPMGVSGYGPDRWFAECKPGLTCTASRILASNLTRSSKYYGMFEFGGSGPAGSAVSQKVEGVKTLQDGPVTVFYEIADSVPQNINVYLIQKFGTGGSPSADVGVLVDTVAAGSAFGGLRKRTVNLPSIGGKTLGTNGDDSLCLSFVCTEPNAHNLFLMNVDIAAGDQTAETAFAEVRLLQQELALCRRYYEVIGPNAGAWAGMGINIGGSLHGFIDFQVEKRVVPAIGLPDPSATFSFAHPTSGSVPGGSLGLMVSYPNTRGFSFKQNVSLGGSSGDVHPFKHSAGNITIDAEL